MPRKARNQASVEPPTVRTVAFASYLYSGTRDFKDTFHIFKKGILGRTDLTNPDHLTRLLVFLRSWGCRQFTTSEESEAERSRVLAGWFRKHERELPETDVDLWGLTDQMLGGIRLAFDSLVPLQAGLKSNCKPRVGSTGAAKILFALRPGSLMAWDAEIANTMAGGRDADSYVRLLRKAKEMAEALRTDCDAHGIKLEELPATLGRTPSTTIPKLIDEYLWETQSQGRLLPDQRILAEWRGWRKASA